MPLPWNVPLVPPVTVTSAVTKSVTSSEKVKVTSRASAALIASGTPPIVTVGTDVSTVKVASAANPRLPAVSK